MLSQKANSNSKSSTQDNMSKEPQKIDLKESIKILGFSVDTSTKTAHHDIPQLVQQF